MNTPLISVIIPIYNVGEYIENSINSLLKQTFTDFEVILVDNNSQDNAIDIAEALLIRNNIRFTTVKQPIQGLPAARNMGISVAKGDWFISIDPDDTVSRFFLESLFDAATSNNLDVVFSEYAEVQEHDLFVFPEEQKQDTLEILEREYTLNKLLTRELPLMVSNMFVRRSYFLNNGFRFDQDVILGADLILVWRLIISIDKIGHLKKKIYNHFFRSDSLITAPSSIKIASNLKGYQRLCQYISENVSEEFSGFVYSRELYGLLSAVSVFGSYALFRENYDKYYDKSIHKSLKSFPDSRIALMDKYLFYSPRSFFLINKLLRQPHSILSRIIRHQ